MKAICFYFQVHQPFRFRKYRFFDIGNDHYYYDDYFNETNLKKVSNRCYLPANRLLLKLIERHKNEFKIAFSLSGLAIEQFELYAPEVLDSFKALADTGQVEFLSETYSHSLVSLVDEDLFKQQIHEHDALIYTYFGQKPQVFRNTELIYSDEIGDTIASMGFKGILAEGAKHVLGWKSSNYLYHHSANPELKILMRNYKLSDDLAFRFSNTDWCEFPLTADKFTAWIRTIEKADCINLFIDYCALGEHQSAEAGIFDFLEHLAAHVAQTRDLSFATPSGLIANYPSVAAIGVTSPSSWADEERDLSAWLSNDLQKEAFDGLFELSSRMKKIADYELNKDWNCLQASDHFYYMCTKYFSDGEVHKYINPYASPYEAFINYMNVLSDFKLRLDRIMPETEEMRRIANLEKLLLEKEQKLNKLEKEMNELRLKQTQWIKDKSPKTAVRNKKFS